MNGEVKFVRRTSNKGNAPADAFVTINPRFNLRAQSAVYIGIIASEKLDTREVVTVGCKNVKKVVSNIIRSKTK